MPYYFKGLIDASSAKSPWELFEQLWRIAHDDLMTVHFETEEEALDQTYRKSLDPDDIRLNSWGVARFRETDDRDNLLYFHDQALGALGETEVAIAAREFSPRFIEQWSLLMSCHGFVVAAMMARGDDLQSKRAGKRGGEAKSAALQQRWFAHYFLIARRLGLDRRKAEAEVKKLIDAIIDGSVAQPEGVDVAWFERFLNLKDDAVSNEHFGKLVKTYRQRRLSEKQMVEWETEPKDDLPLVTVPFPLP